MICKKRIFALASAFLMLISTAGCGTTKANSEVPSSVPSQISGTKVHVATLKGPTGFGMLQMMDQAASENSFYEFSVDTAPDEIVSALASGNADIAAIPTNLAATLYQKTSGNIQMAAVNTLGVLWLVTNGETVSSIQDLKGKSIEASGEGAIPEYALNYILQKNGLEPGKDVTISYSSEHSELAAKVIAGKVSIAVLPEPFVTQVLAKSSEVKRSLDLTSEWDKATSDGSVLSMGCLVVRKEFAEKNPQAVHDFLKSYESSTQFANSSPAEAAKLAETYLAIPAQVAEKAIPNCNIVYIDGQKMKDSIQPFLQVLYDFNPKSVGGALPQDDFYYIEN
jgi:NitT/TauT family transport system substrate-binding protein